jgi:hypothetical protein
MSWAVGVSAEAPRAPAGLQSVGFLSKVAFQRNVGNLNRYKTIGVSAVTPTANEIIETSAVSRPITNRIKNGQF